MKKKMIVIGGGLGGISAAISSAQRGFDVELFEKNSHLGGKLNVLKKDGFSFDLGPSIFTLPQIFRPLFEGSGKKMEDYIPLRKLELQWRNFFEDGSVVDLHEDSALMEAELDKLSPQSFGEYMKFLAYSKLQYDITNKGYFEKGLDGFWEFMKFYGLRGTAGLDFWDSMSGAIEKRISHPKLQAIFEYFIKYVGSSAVHSPAFMNLMPNIQLEYGLWYIDGGLYKLAEALKVRLAECGVKVHLNAEVWEIQKSEGVVKGVQIKHQDSSTSTHSADVVVSNMEIIPAHEKLLGGSQSQLKKLSRFEPACSGIVLHLGTKVRYPQLAHHNFFYSQNQRAHFHRVFKEYKLPDDPTIYLVAPTRSDASQAPEGCENIKILPHIPYINDKSPYTYEDCVKLKDSVLDKLERMGLKDLRKNTIVEDFWTPFDIEKKYYSNKGSIYGVVSDKWTNFAFKAPKKSEFFKNLYFVGGSINPGGGMPMVVLCGQHVARMASEDFS